MRYRFRYIEYDGKLGRGVSRIIDTSENTKWIDDKYNLETENINKKDYKYNKQNHNEFFILGLE